MAKLKYAITTDGNYYKVFINNMLHFSISCYGILGIQTWVKGSGWFCIEIYMKEKNMLLEYDSFDKWKAVINLLNQNIK